MELIEAEPGVRVGRAAVLGGRADVEEAKLARGVGVALLLASATDGRGLTADVGDLIDAPESGDVTEERVGAVAVDASFVTVFAAGAPAASLSVGASDALLPGAAGAAGVAVVGVRAGGGIDVLLLAVAADELEVLRMVVDAAGAFEAAPDVAVVLAAEAAGVLAAGVAEGVGYAHMFINLCNHNGYNTS